MDVSIKIFNIQTKGSMLKKGFSLVELLVVIAIIALLMGILCPALLKARQQAKIVVVNAELSQIALALESYSLDNNDLFPPTRADCNTQARKHIFALPEELVKSGYLTKGKEGNITYAKFQDRYWKEVAYKYIAVGPLYDFNGTPLNNQYLYIPKTFPTSENGPLVKYKKNKQSPVSWAIFSVGPKFDKIGLEEKGFDLKGGFPVLNKFQYSQKTKSGIITRIRLNKNGHHIGTFARR